MKRSSFFKKQAFWIGVGFAIITLLSLLLRFNNFQLLVNFHLDPPLFMHDISKMFDEGRLSLLGPRVDSKIIEGRFFFTGPTFYYLLAILAIVLQWNIVLMTGFFALLWIVTFALIFVWLRERFGYLISLIVYALLSFLPFFLPYSRIIWNPNLIPFLALLLFWFLEKRTKGARYYLLAGFAFGLGVSIHYGVLLLGLVLLYYLVSDLKKKKFSGKSWGLLAGGAIMANAPLLLFEVRHSFYNLQTVIFHIQNYQPQAGYTFSFRSQYYYYLFPIIPLLAKGYAILLEKLEKFNFKVMIASQIILISIFFFYSLYGPQREALINPKGWTIERQHRVVDLIVEDGESGFEVATIIGPDTRAGELRWWLKRAKHEPMSVIDYDKTDILYLIAPKSRPPSEEKVWEIQSLSPFEIEKEIKLGEEFIFYKLRRLSKENEN